MKRKNFDTVQPTLLHRFGSRFLWMMGVIVAFMIWTSIHCGAQLNPMPLGTIANVQSAICPTGFAVSATCSTATLSCPSLPDIGITFGTKGTPTLGTVIFINGDGGNLPYGNGFTSVYAKAGLSSVQFAFATEWELGASNLMEAACRPATVLNYFYQPTVPYAVQSTSAGSGAVGYAFAWYGLSGEFKNWESLVGPPFADIASGCELPFANALTVTPTNGTPFSDPIQYNTEYGFMTNVTGQKCLPKSGTTSAAAISAWNSQSIIQPGATLAYSGNVSGWVCNNGLNPSAAQAYAFFSQVVTPWSLTAISNCNGAEGIATGTTPQGLTGQAAIEADMILEMQ